MVFFLVKWILSSCVALNADLMSMAEFGFMFKYGKTIQELLQNRTANDCRNFFIFSFVNDITIGLHVLPTKKICWAIPQITEIL